MRRGIGLAAVLVLMIPSTAVAADPILLGGALLERNPGSRAAIKPFDGNTTVSEPYPPFVVLRVRQQGANVSEPFEMLFNAPTLTGFGNDLRPIDTLPGFLIIPVDPSENISAVPVPPYVRSTQEVTLNGTRALFGYSPSSFGEGNGQSILTRAAIGILWCYAPACPAVAAFLDQRYDALLEAESLTESVLLRVQGEVQRLRLDPLARVSPGEASRIIREADRLHAEIGYEDWNTYTRLLIVNLDSFAEHLSRPASGVIAASADGYSTDARARFQVMDNALKATTAGLPRALDLYYFSEGLEASDNTLELTRLTLVATIVVFVMGTAIQLLSPSENRRALRQVGTNAKKAVAKAAKSASRKPRK